MRSLVMKRRWIERIMGIDGLDVRRDVPLRDYTTVRIGGRCEAMVEARDSGALIASLKVLRAEGMTPVDLFILGGGSNLLVDDLGFRGIVLRLGNGFRELVEHDDTVMVGAAYPLKDLSSNGVRKGWGGTECFAGHPGTVGGAVRMNAGAWGKEIWDLVRWVYGVNRVGRERVISREEARPGYRTCGLPEDVIVTKAEFSFQAERPAELKRRLKRFLLRRKKRQALTLPSFGSVFRNPEGFHAGKLIDSLGLRGMREGGAMISLEHANFIVNTGEARAADVLALMRLMKQGVLDHYGVELEPEVVFLGMSGKELRGIQ